MYAISEPQDYQSIFNNQNSSPIKLRQSYINPDVKASKQGLVLHPVLHTHGSPVQNQESL